MSTSAASEYTTGESPRLVARATGALWLTCIITGVLGFITDSRVLVRGNAALTASNIIANETVFRLGVVGDLLSGASYVGVTALLYYLLKRVSPSLSGLAAFFGVCGVAIGGISFLSHVAPVVLLGGDQYLNSFTTSQLQTFAFLTFALRRQMFSIGMVFFGIQCVVLGYLIARSTFLPRVLGVLLAIGGASYIVVSFASLIAPAATPWTMMFMPIALVGEGSVTVWLLAKGIDVERWRRQHDAGTRFDVASGGSPMPVGAH